MPGHLEFGLRHPETALTEIIRCRKGEVPDPHEIIIIISFYPVQDPSLVIMEVSVLIFHTFLTPSHEKFHHLIFKLICFLVCEACKAFPLFFMLLMEHPGYQLF